VRLCRSAWRRVRATSIGRNSQHARSPVRDHMTVSALAASGQAESHDTALGFKCRCFESSYGGTAVPSMRARHRQRVGDSAAGAGAGQFPVRDERLPLSESRRQPIRGAGVAVGRGPRTAAKTRYAHFRLAQNSGGRSAVGARGARSGRLPHDSSMGY